MTQAPEIARPAGGPPPGATGGGPGGPPDFQAIAARYLEGHVTGVEGREHEFALGIMQVINTIKDTVPYKHEMNDALVKAWLLAIQFAKDRDILPEFCAKDVETMAPVNARMAQLIAATGEKELALEAIAGYSPCHYHLVLETWKEPGKRIFRSPFKTVLAASVAVGVRPDRGVHRRQLVHPAEPGVRRAARRQDRHLAVAEDGMITVSLAE